MASVQEEINRIEQAKTDVKGAIIDCGVDVPSTAKIDTYANYIRTIPQSVFSQFTSNKVGGTDKFIQSVEQKNGIISATAGGLVSTTASGLAPKIPSTAAGTIDSSTTDWVLTYNNGSIGWYKLPSGAFCTDTNVTQTDTTGNSTYRVLLSGSANDTTDTTTARKSAKLLFNTSSGKMDLSGSLQITTSIADHNSPAAQCLVINSTEVPSGTTLSLKNSPGIGFHIANNSWASLIWGPGGFNFINSDASGYANLKAGSGTFSGQIISSVYTGTSPFNVISTTVNTNLNADMVDGYHVATSGDHKPWGMLVSIGDTGVSEMGRYIDYHYDNTTGSDYSTRLQCDGNHGNTVTLPSGTGTLALTSQIPTNTWRSITDSYSGTDSNISLSQKGGNALYNALLNGYASSAGNAETVDDYHIWTGSALEYAGTTHDASTLYFITD